MQVLIKYLVNKMSSPVFNPWKGNLFNINNYEKTLL